MLDRAFKWVIQWFCAVPQMNYNKLCACVEEDAIHPEFESSLAKARTRIRLHAFAFDSVPCRMGDRMCCCAPLHVDLPPRALGSRVSAECASRHKHCR